LALWNKYAVDKESMCRAVQPVVLCTEATIPEGYSPLILNTQHGGWSVSHEAAKALGATHRGDLHQCRNDLALANYILTHGSEAASGPHSKLVVYMTQTELVPYVDVEEYDGLEDWVLNSDRLRADLLEQALRVLCNQRLQTEFFARMK
jgi:hypothetical protein